MYKNILMFLIVISIMLIVVDVTKTNETNKPTKVIYRYIPRTLSEELDSPVYATDILKTMFKQPSPWMLQLDNKLLDEANRKFFVSQF